MKIIREDKNIKLSIDEIEYLSNSNYIECKNINFNVYENSGTLIGNIELYNYRPSNGNSYITIYIKEEYRKMGYGTRLLKKIINFSKKNLRLHRLTAEIYDYNMQSIKLFKKFGFVAEGRIREAKYFNGKYHDILIFGKIMDSEE